MFALWMTLAAISEAHKPSYGGDWDTPEDAFEVADPDISIVVYREIVCDSPELWLTFEATAGEDVWVQLGVPEIDRLSSFKPSMAVIGPGLPADGAGDLPFDVPAGLGAVVIPSGEISSFYEPFTQTSSWIHAERWVTMPQDGTSYLVAWNPEGTTGKLWLAMGLVEDFSDVDWTEAAAWGEDVNNFHETGVYEPAPEVEEIACDAEAPAHGDDHAHGTPERGGCDTTAGSAGASGALLALAGAIGAARRRRGR